MPPAFRRNGVARRSRSSPLKIILAKPRLYHDNPEELCPIRVAGPGAAPATGNGLSCVGASCPKSRKVRIVRRLRRARLFRSPSTGGRRARLKPTLEAGALPPELDFIAGERVSGQRLLAALTAAPAGAPPLDVLLNEGMLPEETYYRALARRLGCEYYRGEPPFAKNFDPVKSLKCGVAPVYERGQPVRAVIAPGARSVRGLIEMTRSGRLHPTSFAITSPQRFASFVRMRRGDAILDDALGRLPARLSARAGMSGAQIAAAGLIAASALGLAIADPPLLAACLSAGLWAIFLASIALRSMAAVADGATPRPRMLTDHELPVYTIVARALSRIRGRRGPREGL